VAAPAPRRVADASKLAAYLESQRWFGDKSAAIAEARVVNRIPVRWPGSEREFAVLRVRVTTGGGASFYQLFVTDDESLDDAVQDAEFRRGLVDAFARGDAFAGDGARWIVESESAAPLVVPPAATISLASGEQTNTSVVIDGEAILKLYRKVEPGIHPDVEVTRFLTIARSFVHTPALLGTIRFEDRDGVTTAGMLQELVPRATDAWKYALQISRPYFEGKLPRRKVLPFEEEAVELGRVTRALHETLASGEPGSAFECRAATPDDARRWTRAARDMAARALASLERASQDSRLPAGEAESARRMVERRAAYAEWLETIGAGIASDAGAVTRTHGDYHLGQVLRSATDKFLIIDFEGEPARPLAERRAHQSPLRDVAGMLRSFAYAAAVGGGTESEGMRRAQEWGRVIRDAFLRGYFMAPASGVSLLPRSRSNADRLVALFEAEKIFYELQYELDHRPDWVWIPLRGIAEIET
jgi:maltose alpha-D-glucosyltransferase/alpha-amylase